MKSWFILILFAISLIPFALKAGVLEKMLFANKGYAEQIEVKTYVLTQEQIVELFKNPDKEPIQKIVSELYSIKNTYFTVRVKNIGKNHAWGKLSCKVPSIVEPIVISIPSINNEFCDYIICVSGILISSGKDSSYPNISYEWAELYTK